MEAFVQHMHCIWTVFISYLPIFFFWHILCICDPYPQSSYRVVFFGTGLAYASSMPQLLCQYLPTDLKILCLQSISLAYAGLVLSLPARGAVLLRRRFLLAKQILARHMLSMR